MIVETIALIIIDIIIFAIIVKFVQLYVSKLAKTSQDRYHTIYQGGESLEAKQRKYQSSLYVLIIIFLILHIFVFLLATIVYLNLDSIIYEVILFLLIFIYAIVIIRKGVNYS